MKKTLIIGGAGYVGSVLTSHLLNRNHKVIVLDNFVYKNQSAVVPFLGDPNYTLLVGDMRNINLLEEASRDVNNVIILAGLVGDPITKKYPEEAYLINDQGIESCINFYDDKNIEKMIFVSTCSNYGLIGENELADENFALNPLSLYAKSKVAAETHVLSKKGKVSYSATVLRFATAFGLSPRMRFDLTISEFTRDLFFGQELLVFDEHTWRPYCHVRDFARLIDLVLECKDNRTDFEVFNAGGNHNNFTKKMVIDLLCEKIPNSKVSYNQKGSDPRNYRVSFEKVKSTLGFEPAYTVEMGIDELINALSNGVFSDSADNKDGYGNYTINYPTNL